MNFRPPFSEPPSFFFFFSYPSNIEIIFDFSDIITKIHPAFQNPGSALARKLFAEKSLCIRSLQRNIAFVLSCFQFLWRPYLEQLILFHNNARMNCYINDTLMTKLAPILLAQGRAFIV